MECELGGGKLSCLCAEQRPIPLTQNNRLCEDLGKHLLSAVTFTLVQQFHMVVEAEKTPNLLEELETWRKSSWEGEGEPAAWASSFHDSLAEGEP